MYNADIASCKKLVKKNRGFLDHHCGEMAQNSNTICDKIKQCLGDIDEVDKLLTTGFVREILNEMKNEDEIIPTAIVDYCIIFAFLKWKCWLKGGQNWSIQQYTATRNPQTTSFETIYADPLIKRGKYEWKIKVVEKSTDIAIGLVSNMNHCNKYAMSKSAGEYNYFYISYAGIMSHNKRNSTDYPSAKTKRTYKTGDIITVHLDLDSLTIGFSKNGEYLGIAYENIANVEYRLAVCVGKKQKQQIVQIIQ